MQTFPMNSSILTVEALTDAQIETLQSRMYPDAWSEGGFLKVGQSLKSLVEEDRKVLNCARITFEQIADCLDSIIARASKKGFALSGRPCSLDDKYTVTIKSYLGSQECPFELDEAKLEKEKYCGEGSMDISVKRLDSGDVLAFSSLMPHLIRDHHFFQGGPYRVDPMEAIRFFELKPLEK